MTLSIHNFSTHLDTDQLKKGKEYFVDGAVTYITESKPDVWKAEVEGTDTYYVKVILAKELISETRCDCPHDDPFCKHVVAVLFSIQQQKGSEVPAPDSKAVPKGKKASGKAPSFDAVLEKSTPKDLKEFVKSFAARNKEFRNLFLLRFALNNKENGVEKFTAMIRETAAAYTRRGFIEWNDSKKALQPAVDILEEAELSFEKENFRITFDACCAIVLQVPPLLNAMDDSNGTAGDCIYGAFDLLQQLAQSTTVPYALKDELFGFAKKEFGKPAYSDFDFDYSLLQLMVTSAYDEDKEKIVFAVIEWKLTKAGEEYNRKRLLDAKIKLLQQTGKEKEAAALLQNNVTIWQYREELIEHYIGQKNYEEAKKLATDGVQSENNKDGWQRNTGRWEAWLLKIALLQEDVPAVRKLCKNLYFDRSFNHSYYEIYRKTFTETEWQKEREGWISCFFAKGNRVMPQQMYALATIYAAEEFYDRLLDLLQKNPSYEFAEFCKPHLKGKYDQELVSVYRQSLITYAASTNDRSHYIELRKRLRNLQQVAGGKELTKELVANFLIQYKQRRAMKEELEKLIL